MEWDARHPLLVRASQRSVEPSAHGTPKEVILRAGVLPNVTQVAAATLENSTAFEPHVHPTMYEVYFVMEGQAAFRISEDTFDVGLGDFLIVPPATPHSLRVTAGPFRIFYWGIAEEAGKDALNSTALPSPASKE